MEAIRTYVTGAFARVETTQAALDQQAEIIADMEAQFADLVAEGKSEAEALGATIAGMGDLDEIVAGFPQAGSTVGATAPAAPAAPPKIEPVDVEVKRAKWQLLTTLGSIALSAVGLAVLAGIGMLGGAQLSTAGLMIIGATAVGVWKAWEAVRLYRSAPDTLGSVRVHDRARLRSALLWWAGGCTVALVLNASSGAGVGGGGFWAWVLWAAGAYWPISIWVGERIALDGIVSIAPATTATSADVAEAGAVHA